jgi:hypothetical protein
MVYMKRILLASLAAAMAGMMIVPGLAAASIVELGETSSAPLVAPVCPPGVSAADCSIVLTRVTAIATVRAGVAYPTMVKRGGYIVAFTIGLSALSSNRATRKKYIHNLDSQFSGTTQVQATVLQPVGPHKDFAWKVVAQSPPIHVQPYLGEVVQFPLATALPVKRGDVIALTTPTWAPVLSIKLDHSQFAYRQGRRINCGNPAASQQAQLQIGQVTNYKCDYPGTRIEYTATEVISPTYPKNYVHARDLKPAIIRR